MIYTSFKYPLPGLNYIFVYNDFHLSLNREYNPFLVYCRELAPRTVSLTGDRAQGDDSKHDLHFTHLAIF